MCQTQVDTPRTSGHGCSDSCIMIALSSECSIELIRYVQSFIKLTVFLNDFLNHSLQDVCLCIYTIFSVKLSG